MKISFLSQSLISLAVLSACGGSAIGDAQDFSPNVPPVIMSLSAHNTDGTDVTIADIEPYKQFKIDVEASDDDGNPLSFTFDSESGSFSGITNTVGGCTAVFKTGRIIGGHTHYVKQQR